jgi:hypothetical protein
VAAQDFNFPDADADGKPFLRRGRRTGSNKTYPVIPGVFLTDQDGNPLSPAGDATAANQVTEIARLTSILAAAVAATPAGLAEIGKVNWRHINVAGATLTRPANQTPYTALDSISDNATAGSVTALTSNNLSDTNDDPITLSQIVLDTTDTGPGTAGATIRIHAFNSDPTASSGVGAGDNATWSNKRAGWIGSFSGVMTLFSDGSRGILAPDAVPLILAFPATGAKNIWWQIQALVAFTPSANSTTFTPRFKGYQGRL